MSCETWQTNSKVSRLDISLFNYFHPLSLKVSAEHQSAVIQTPVGQPGLSPFHLMCSVTEYVSRVCVHTRLTTDVVVSVHMIGIEGKLRAFAAGIQWMCWVFFLFSAWQDRETESRDDRRAACGSADAHLKLTSEGWGWVEFSEDMKRKEGAYACHMSQCCQVCGSCKVYRNATHSAWVRFWVRKRLPFQCQYFFVCLLVCLLVKVNGGH